MAEFIKKYHLSLSMLILSITMIIMTVNLIKCIYVVTIFMVSVKKGIPASIDVFGITN